MCVVICAPFSEEIPCYQGKYREIFAFSGIPGCVYAMKRRGPCVRATLSKIQNSSNRELSGKSRSRGEVRLLGNLHSWTLQSAVMHSAVLLWLHFRTTGRSNVFGKVLPESGRNFRPLIGNFFHRLFSQAEKAITRDLTSSDPALHAGTTFRIPEPRPTPSQRTKPRTAADSRTNRRT